MSIAKRRNALSVTSYCRRLLVPLDWEELVEVYDEVYVGGRHAVATGADAGARVDVVMGTEMRVDRRALVFVRAARGVVAEETRIADRRAEGVCQQSGELLHAHLTQKQGGRWLFHPLRHRTFAGEIGLDPWAASEPATLRPKAN